MTVGQPSVGLHGLLHCFVLHKRESSVLPIHFLGQPDAFDAAEFLKQIANVLLSGLESDIPNDEFGRLRFEPNLLFLSSVGGVFDLLFRYAELESMSVQQ